MTAVPTFIVCAVVAVLDIALLLARYDNEFSVTKSSRLHQSAHRRSLERKSLLRKEYCNELKSCSLLSSCYPSLIDSL